MQARYILYGRRGCHLCDEMAAALAARGVAFDKVNVDADRELAARYGVRVPVLTDAQGHELCYGRLDPSVL
jgi:glutaredoxin